jgi:hypothetical protein
MKGLRKLVLLLIGCCASMQVVFCQIAPAATALLRLSVFGAGTGAWTGFDGGTIWPSPQVLTSVCAAFEDLFHQPRYAGHTRW